MTTHAKTCLTYLQGDNPCSCGTNAAETLSTSMICGVGIFNDIANIFARITMFGENELAICLALMKRNRPEDLDCESDKAIYALLEKAVRIAMNADCNGNIQGEK